MKLLNISNIFKEYLEDKQICNCRFCNESIEFNDFYTDVFEYVRIHNCDVGTAYKIVHDIYLKNEKIN